MIRKKKHITAVSVTLRYLPDGGLIRLKSVVEVTFIKKVTTDIYNGTQFSCKFSVLDLYVE